VLPSLADVGITAGDLKKLAEDAMKKSGLLINNRREVRYDVVLAVLYGSLRKPGRCLSRPLARE
jgi:hypothetical protein